jgi:hypothetical protein
MYVDRHGEVLSRGQFLRVRTLALARVTAYAAVMGAVVGGLASSLLPGVIAGGLTAALLHRKNARPRRTLTRVTALVTAGQLVEARAVLSTLDGQMLDPHWAFALARLQYRLDWMDGAHARALAKCVRLCRRYRHGQTLHDAVWLFAIAGRASSARKVLAAMPRDAGEWATLRRESAELRIAFLEGALPTAWDSNRLHDAARVVLQTSLFGGVCALLAWAFERRGDVEMTRHLVSETPSRLGESSLAAIDPPLHAWFVAAGRRDG